MTVRRMKTVVQLQVILYQEKRHWIAHCPALELSAVGKTREDVKKEFHKSFKLWVMTVYKKDALSDVLKGLGWKYNQKEVAPPEKEYELPGPGPCISMTENLPIPLQAMA